VSGVISAISIFDVRDCYRSETYRMVVVSPKNLLLPLFDVSLGATVVILQELARMFL
jgi:hypothetical protein